MKGGRKRGGVVRVMGRWRETMMMKGKVRETIRTPGRWGGKTIGKEGWKILEERRVEKERRRESKVGGKGGG